MATDYVKTLRLNPIVFYGYKRGEKLFPTDTYMFAQTRESQ